MLAARYGLTSAQWDALYAEQGGRCAACGQHCPSRGRYALHTDHDHNTGKVRALLCQGCNVAEGCLEGDPQRAIQLAAYMQSFKDEIPQ
jgi:Pyruvate/2-oxoacid:ferredoxin oxidoreductase delta subunit